MSEQCPRDERHRPTRISVEDDARIALEIAQIGWLDSMTRYLSYGDDLVPQRNSEPEERRQLLYLVLAALEPHMTTDNLRVEPQMAAGVNSKTRPRTSPAVVKAEEAMVRGKAALKQALEHLKKDPVEVPGDLLDACTKGDSTEVTKKFRSIASGARGRYVSAANLYCGDDITNPEERRDVLNVFRAVFHGQEQQAARQR
ncbi:MAG: hypothetical protein Fues2KO_04670 [Fuerstiella sp.]